MSDQPDLTHAEERQVRERQAPAAVVLHEIIRRQGDDELERPAVSLLWSGFAAGIAIFASILGEALIESKLPDAPWRPLVAAFGYTLGFLIVVLGRLQLFTENTLSAVIPTVTQLSFGAVWRLLRLWGLVFAANMAGTLLVAAMVHFGLIGLPEQGGAMLELARTALDHPPGEVVRAGIPAGFLIAGVAWCLPIARGQSFWVVLVFTYFIALGGFAHVVAGSGEAWLMMLAGERSVAGAVGGYILPALAGNLIGGSVMFALLAHAQVRGEL
jgi:formate/nitrite transporter FocA (FNT family)